MISFKKRKRLPGVTITDSNGEKIAFGQLGEANEATMQARAYSKKELLLKKIFTRLQVEKGVKKEVLRPIEFQGETYFDKEEVRRFLTSIG